MYNIFTILVTIFYGFNVCKVQCQSIFSSSESCTGPDEVDILRKEQATLHNIVRTQAIRLETLQQEIASIKKQLSECCTSPGPKDDETDPSLGHYGKEFIIAFPKSKGQISIVQVLITSQEDTDVTFESSHPKINKTFHVTSSSGHIELLPTSIVMDQDGLFNKGVVVRSTQGITVHCIAYCGCNAFEGYLAYPRRHLGTKYVLANSDYANVVIISPEKSSKITLSIYATSNVVTWKGKNYTEGDSITFEQQSDMQTFQFSAMGYLFGVIESTKPVAVISGSYNDGSSFEPNSFMEYLIPENHLSDKYVIPTFNETQQDIYQFLFDDETDNSVTIPGNDVTKGIKGDLLYYAYGNRSPCVVKASGKMMPAVFSSHQSTFMTIVPSLEQFSNDYRFITPSSVDLRHYFVITIPTKHFTGLIIDNVPHQRNEKNTEVVTDGMDQYDVITISIAAGFHHVYHSNNVTFGLILYGYGNRQKLSYGYPAGIRFK